MSLSVKELEIQNFMSVEHSKVGLSNRGLVLITGDNQDNDAFESNGTGKSAFFSESITWALFGKTIRPTSANGVINRKAKKNTMVHVTLVEGSNGDIYEIYRYRKHAQYGNHVLLFHNGNNITGKSDSDTTEMIEDLIGMDYLTFTNSIMFGQGMVKLFASATDAEQKKILEQMVQIYVYRLAQEEAKKEVAERDRDIESMSKSMEKDLSLKSSLESTIEELQAKELELGEKVEKRISELNVEMHNLEQQVDHLQKERKEADEALVELYAGLDTVYSKLETYKPIEDQAEELKDLIKSNNTNKNRLEKLISEEEKKLNDIRIGKNIPKICEACGQPLPLDDTSHVENHLEQSIENYRTEVRELDEDSATLTSLLDKVKKQLLAKDKLEETLEEAKETIAELKSDIKQIDIKLKSKQDAIQSLNKQVKEQEELRNTTYTDLINSTVEQVNVLSKSIQEQEEALQKERNNRDKYAFWVEAFGNKGIKSVLLDSVTPFLNKQCNYYIGKLAGDSIEVTFNTQQEVTSGKNKGQKVDKFEVVVDNKNGDEGYDGNSGGEKRRVDIAINMALQDLVMSRSSKRLDLIVYDECFEGLDAIGCESVIQLLNEKARQCGTVLVITHNDNLKQLFSKTLMLAKVDGATKVLEE